MNWQLSSDLALVRCDSSQMNSRKRSSLYMQPGLPELLLRLETKFPIRKAFITAAELFFLLVLGFVATDFSEVSGEEMTSKDRFVDSSSTHK